MVTEDWVTTYVLALGARLLVEDGVHEDLPHPEFWLVLEQVPVYRSQAFLTFATWHLGQAIGTVGQWKLGSEMLETRLRVLVLVLVMWCVLVSKIC